MDECSGFLPSLNCSTGIFCWYILGIAFTYTEIKCLSKAQTLVMPPRVRRLLGLRNFSLLAPLMGLYKLIRIVKMDWLLKLLILPSRYKNEIKALDSVPKGA